MIEMSLRMSDLDSERPYILTRTDPSGRRHFIIGARFDNLIHYNEVNDKSGWLNGSMTLTTLNDLGYGIVNPHRQFVQPCILGNEKEQDSGGLVELFVGQHVMFWRDGFLHQFEVHKKSPHYIFKTVGKHPAETKHTLRELSADGYAFAYVKEERRYSVRRHYQTFNVIDNDTGKSVAQMNSANAEKDAYTFARMKNEEDEK